MAHVLVVFESRYGQASKIAEHIGQKIRERGHATRVVHVDGARGLGLAAFDSFVIVSPVYFAHHPRSIARFVRSNADALAGHPSAFVSVSNSAANADPAVRANAMRVARSFVAELPWAPAFTTTAGGAIAYPRYNWALRYVMKRIAIASGMPTDTTRSHEVTDWAALDRDIASIVSRVGGDIERRDDRDALHPAAE